MSFILAEGTYSTYAIYDSFDDDLTLYAENTDALINCLDTKAILIKYYTHWRIQVYDIDAKTLGTITELSNFDLGNTITGRPIFKQTFLNTYVAIIERTTNNLLIYKDGALLQTLTPTELGITAGTLFKISFSPRGKYIFLAGERSASGHNGWVVLKGT
jgi:hypothetical protein